MIDIHTHILYSCDDGSPDIETSLDTLKAMVDQGISQVILTPHFIKNQYHNTRLKNISKVTELKKQVNEQNIPVNIHIGSEVYLEHDSVEDIENEMLMVNETNYVLVETGMSEFPVNFFDILFNLVRKGYRPVLAHPERYAPIMNHTHLAEDLMYRNVYLQLNVGSFLGMYGKKVEHTAWRLIDKGYAHFLASDNHCRDLNFPIQNALQIISERYDSYLVELLTEVNPQKLLNNQKIDFFYLKNVPLPQESKLRGLINKITKIFN